MTYIQLTSNSPQLSAYLRGVAKELPEVLDEAVRESVTDALAMFGSVTATWTTRPTFEVQHEGTGRWGIKTSSEIFKWVDQGTRRHPIDAKHAPYLVFRMPYTAKTAPNVIASYAGARGDRWVSRKHVDHPGTKPRNFSRIIAKQAQGPTKARLRGALKQATYGPGAGL